MEDLQYELEEKLKELRDGLEIMYMGEAYYEIINARIDEVKQIIKFIENLTVPIIGSYNEPLKSVIEFAKWCNLNNDMLYKKGSDVFGCIIEWENYLSMHKKQ